MRYALLALTVALSGCGVVIPIVRSESKLATISPGITHEEVVQRLGAPTSLRGARKLEDGRLSQVDRYVLYSPGASFFDALAGPFLLTMSWWIPSPRYETSYLFKYIDGRLEQWGKASDMTADVTLEATVRQK